MLFVVAVLAAAQAVFYLLIGIGQPLIDIHGFRQTQTALSVYWLAHGGPWLAYETPVLGAPWSAPFEFPLYQWLVAIPAAAGVPIEVAGRLVSFAFFLGCLWPIRMLGRTLKWPAATTLVVAVLFLASPIYVFWARTLMIETCALFFCLLWLALFVRFMDQPGNALLAGTIAAGAAGVLTKATTFPAFGLIGGLLFLAHGFKAWRAGEISSRWVVLAKMAVAGLVPLLVGAAWTAFADHVKEASPVGVQFTSSALSAWEWGSLDQRFSKAFWWDVVVVRVLPDIFGSLGMIGALLAMGAATTSRRYARPAALAGAGFLTAFLLFTNLHQVHNYYQSANALFVIAAAGFGIATLLEGGRPLLATAMLAIVVAGQVAHFNDKFRPAIVAGQSAQRQLRIAALVRAHTTPEQSLLILGEDWSSAIPFYSERKALVVPGWLSPEIVTRAMEAPQSLLGDRPLGAIVYCADKLGFYGETLGPRVAAFAAGHKVIAEYGGCQVLSPTLFQN